MKPRGRVNWVCENSLTKIGSIFNELVYESAHADALLLSGDVHGQLEIAHSVIIGDKIADRQPSVKTRRTQSKQIRENQTKLVFNEAENDTQ